MSVVGPAKQQIKFEWFNCYLSDVQLLKLLSAIARALKYSIIIPNSNVGIVKCFHSVRALISKVPNEWLLSICCVFVIVRTWSANLFQSIKDIDLFWKQDVCKQS